MLKLSIIVPVYNVEPYIRPCIESIFNQGLNENDYEVIIVNDGTKDRSMEVIQDIIALHKNITVINQENQGLSMARNNGMAIARGEYLLFVDSDDLLVENSVKPLLEKALETKADMVVADFLEMNDEEIGLRQVVQEKTNSFQIKTGKQLYLEYFTGECYVWRTLYKKAFLRSNHLSFYPGIYFEDIPFTNECYLTANLCIKANHLMYVYRKGHSSISSVKIFDLKKAHDLCIALKKTWELRKKEGLSPEIIKKLNYMCFCTFCRIRERSLYVFESYSQKVAVIKMLKGEVPDLRFTHGFKQKLDYLFYRASSHLYIIWRMLIKRFIWHNLPETDSSGTN